MKINGKQIELQSNYTQHADNLLRFERFFLGSALCSVLFCHHQGSCNGESLMCVLAAIFHFTFPSDPALSVAKERKDLSQIKSQYNKICSLRKRRRENYKASYWLKVFLLLPRNLSREKAFFEGRNKWIFFFSFFCTYSVKRENEMNMHSFKLNCISSLKHLTD